jgi:ribosomal protein S21
MNTLSQPYADLSEKFRSSGIFQDMRKHRHFETPIEKSKRKKLALQKQGKRRFRT